MNTTETKTILDQFTVVERAVLYARVSGDDRKKDGRNLEGQIEMGQEYATEKGYRIVAELPEDDKGASGAEIDLPQLNRIREMARNREFDVLIVRELDRLSRSLAKQLIVEEELNRAGVRVEYVLAEYDDTPEGRLSKHIRATIAEYEREKIRERMVRGRRRKIQAGSVFVSSRAPFGYGLVNVHGITCLEVDLIEAEIIRLIFELFVNERLSVYKICLRLDMLGQETRGDTHPLIRNKKLKNSQWSGSSVNFILHNETYAGVWRYSKKGQPIALEVPAIVSREIWEAAQARFAYNRRNSPGNTKNEYLLARVVTCGCCQYKMVTRPQYYFCPSSHRDYTRTCNLPHFRVDKVHARIWEWLENFLKDPEARKRGLADHQARMAQKHNPLTERLATIEALISKNEAEWKEEMANLRAVGSERAKAAIGQEIDRIEAIIDELKAQRATLERQIEVKMLTDQQVMNIEQYAAELAKRLDVIREDFESRRRLVELLDMHVTLFVENGKKKAHIECYFGEDDLSINSNSVVRIAFDLQKNFTQRRNPQGAVITATVTID